MSQKVGASQRPAMGRIWANHRKESKSMWLGDKLGQEG